MGYAFDQYIQTLQQKRQLEAQGIAQKKARTSMIVQEIANAGVGLLQAFQQNKQLEQQAKQAYMEVGAPGADKVETKTDMHQRELQSRIDAIKSGLVDSRTASLKDDPNISKLINDYTNELNELNGKLAEIDTYKRTPQYQQEKVDYGFRQFIGVPLNKEKLMQTYGAMQEQSAYEKKSGRELEMYEKKNAIDAKYAQPRADGTSAVAYGKAKTYTDSLQRRFDNVDSNMLLTPEAKQLQKDILLETMDVVGSAKTSQELDQAYNEGLQKLNKSKPVETMAPAKENRKQRRAREKAEKQAMAQKAIDSLAQKYIK